MSLLKALLYLLAFQSPISELADTHWGEEAPKAVLMPLVFLLQTLIPQFFTVLLVFECPQVLRLKCLEMFYPTFPVLSRRAVLNYVVCHD